MSVNLKNKPDKVIGEMKYYNTDSISKILELNPWTIYDYYKADYLPAIKIGKSWFVSKENLEYFIVNGKLKKTEDLTFKDYKTLESDLINGSEKNLQKMEKILNDLESKYPINWLNSKEVYQKTKKRYENLKKIMKECKNEKMTKKDFDTFI